MIRELKLICSDCQRAFVAQEKLFYKETFQVRDFSELPLICPDCWQAWQQYWQIAEADFFEEYACLYVNLKLANGEEFTKLDCTPMSDIVVTSIDIPEQAQKALYLIYKKWYDEKMKDCLKICEFTETFMRTAFTCETFGGDRYEDIAFRFNRLGIMETEVPVPELIKQQVIEKWHAYELMNMPVPDLSDKE